MKENYINYFGREHKWIVTYQTMRNFLIEYERIESRLNNLFIQTDLTDSAKKKLELTMKKIKIKDITS